MRPQLYKVGGEELRRSGQSTHGSLSPNLEAHRACPQIQGYDNIYPIGMLVFLSKA